MTKNLFYNSPGTKLAVASSPCINPGGLPSPDEGYNGAGHASAREAARSDFHFSIPAHDLCPLDGDMHVKFG
jgi:hypothetical protein